MKLHEFTDRLYAMGGIEKEGKRSRILNESLNGDIDESLIEAVTNAVKIECAVEPFNKCFIADGFDWEDSDTLWTAPGDIDNARLFDEYNWEEELQEILDECTDGSFTVDDFIVHDHFEESLTEARNPENDEVNAAIKRYLASDKAYIPKKDRDLFDRYGITPGKFQRKLGRYMDGSNGEVISADYVDMVHPDYDLAGDLTKKKPDKGDKEYPTKDWMGWRDYWGDRPISKNDDSTISPNQFKSLQPYASEKEAIWDAKRRRDRALQDEKERIQDIKDQTQRTLGYINDDKAKYMKLAKEKAAERHKARQNESLGLNETGGIPGYSNYQSEKRLKKLFDKLSEFDEDRPVDILTKYGCKTGNPAELSEEAKDKAIREITGILKNEYKLTPQQIFNESLELNESKQGLIDELWKTMKYINMSVEDTFDILLGLMDESQILELIDELKLYEIQPDGDEIYP